MAKTFFSCIDNIVNQKNGLLANTGKTEKPQKKY